MASRAAAAIEERRAMNVMFLAFMEVDAFGRDAQADARQVRKGRL
jgi:hypothetical protein